MIRKELKQAIINWLLENENKWQRISACIQEFRPYIYTDEGNYLIGGKEVSNWIHNIDKILFDVQAELKEIDF